MRFGLHFRLDEAPHAGAHLVHRVIEAAIAEGRSASSGDHQLDETRPCGGSVAGDHQSLDRRPIQGRQIAAGEAEIGKPCEFCLVHRDAARNLVQIFPGGDLDEELLHLAEFLTCGEPGGIGGKFSQDGIIGGEPGEAMDSMLLALDQMAGKLALGGDAGLDPRLGMAIEAANDALRLLEETREIGKDRAIVSNFRHSNHSASSRR